MTDYVVGAGQTKTGVELQSGFFGADSMEVLAGGTASDTTVDSGTVETVFFGGTDVNASISGGQIIDGGFSSVTTIFAGRMDIVGGGLAQSVEIFGGFEVVSNGGLDEHVSVENGGTQYVESGGTADFSFVLAGGKQIVRAGGSATNAATIQGEQDLYGTFSSGSIDSNGLQIVESGGLAISAVLVSGAEQRVFGVASGTDVTTFGGNLQVESGGVVISAVVVAPIDLGSEFVQAGGTDEFATIELGVIDQLGGSNASQEVFGKAISATVGIDGNQDVSPGGEADFTTVSGGGVQAVEGSGIAIGTLVSGADDTLTLDSGLQDVFGTARSAVIGDGGSQTIEDGGTASDTVLSGGSITAINPLLGTISGGVQDILSGGAAVATQIVSGSELVESGGNANTTTILDDSGNETVSAGGTDVSATISGGWQDILADGTAILTQIVGGSQFVEVGGEADNASVSSVGTQDVFGSARDTSVFGGTMVVEAGATVDATHVEGGYVSISAGGLAGNTIIDAGVETILSGASETGTLINGGEQDVVGVAVGALLEGGGQVVVAGGSAGQTTVDSGTLTVSGGGEADGASLDGGAMLVYGGGGASGTTLATGGYEIVGTGATDADATISSGGSQAVAAGGTTTDPLVAGGLLELQDGAAVNGSIQFADSGGVLQIDGTTMPGNVITGFTLGDTIDLRGLGTPNPKLVLDSSNVLHITENGQTYLLQFDAGVAGMRFGAASDQAGGTNIKITSTTSRLKFTGAIDSNWNSVTTDDHGFVVATNWTGNLIPGAGDDLTIDQSQAVTLTGTDFNGNTDTADSLTIAAGSSLAIGAKLVLVDGSGNNGIALDNAGAITISHGRLNAGYHETNTGAILIGDQGSALLSGSLFNAGTITLHPGGGNYSNDAFLFVDTAGLTLTGAGTVLLQPFGGNASNELTGSDKAVRGTLHNVDNTITGSGAIGQGGVSFLVEPSYLLALDNQDAGRITGGAGDSLLLGNLPVTNEGVISAVDGGGLVMQNATVTQSSTGIIAAIGAGSHVDLNNSTIYGGLLTTTDGGIIGAVANTTNKLVGIQYSGYGYNTIPLTNTGVLAVNQSHLVLYGTLHNSGFIDLQSGGGNYSNFSVVNIAIGDLILDGGGSIAMQPFGNNANEITGISDSTVTTLHNIDNTITGSGAIGQGALSFEIEPHELLNLDNQAAGKVIAGAGNTLELGVTTVSNAGTLAATAGGALSVVQTTITQTGTGIVLASGAGSHVDLSGATIRGGTLATDNGGVIRAVGGANVLDGTTAYGAVTNNGTIFVGNAPAATLTLQGPFHNSGTIVLQTGGGNYSNTAFLNIGASGVTLDGHGSILLQHFGNDANQITGASSTIASTLHNVDNTISGAGGIGQYAVAFEVDPHDLLLFDNQAAGIVDSDAGHAIILGGLTVTNAGTLEATYGSELRLQAARVEQSGNGVIVADGSNSFVGLNGATIVGGRLVTANGGVVRPTGGVNLLDGTTAYGAVTNDGTIFIGNAPPATLTLQGPFHNNGTIVLQTGGGNYSNTSFLNIGASGVTLDGHGSILLQRYGNDANQIIGASTTITSTLHNVDNTISGAGGIGQDAVSFLVDPHDLLLFDNEAAGIVDSDAGQAIVLGSLTVTNTGTLEATNGSELLLQAATVEQSGNGVILADGANSFIGLDGATVAGGLLATANGGVVRPVSGVNVLDGSTSYGALSNAASVLVGGGSLVLQGTIHNSGTISLQSTGANYSNTSFLTIGALGATLDGSGRIALQAFGNNANQIIGDSTTIATTLHNAGTISGVGGIGQGAVSFLVDPHDLLVLDNLAGGTIDADIAGTTLLINTGATVINDGVLEADGGTLVIDDAVTGAGHVVITDGGTADINGAFQQDVAFDGAGTLTLADAAASVGGYIGHISGWGSSDVVDVPGVGFSATWRVLVGADGTNEGLFVVDSANNDALVAFVDLTGSYTAQNFVLSDDQHGGLQINETGFVPPPPPTARDFNGDGRSDVLFQNTNGNLAMWQMNGPTVASSSIFAFADPSVWSIKGTGDCNGDGKADILWQDQSGDIAVWQMNGATVAASSLIGFADPAWHIVTTGDFNGDGMSDLLFQHTDGNLAMWQMNGTSVAASSIFGFADPSWHIRGSGDFNGDGKADLLWQNDNGNVAVWEMSGTTVIASGLPGFADSSWHIRGCGDFNGDGRSDILWQNDNGNLAIWEMNGSSIASSSIFAFVDPTAWHVAGIGDYSGDGKADILWQDQSGDIAMWQMNGTTVAASSLVGFANPSWHIVPPDNTGSIPMT